MVDDILYLRWPKPEEMLNVVADHSGAHFGCGADYTFSKAMKCYVEIDAQKIRRHMNRRMKRNRDKKYMIFWNS